MIDLQMIQKIAQKNKERKEQKHIRKAIKFTEKAIKKQAKAGFYYVTINYYQHFGNLTPLYVRYVEKYFSQLGFRVEGWRYGVDLYWGENIG